MPWMAVGAAVSAAASAYAAHRSSKANTYATQMGTEAANRAADLEAKSAEEALAFAKEQEATRRREFEQTQQQNYGMWLKQREDLSPYRRLGAGSVLQLAQPIPRRPVTGPTLFGG